MKKNTSIRRLVVGLLLAALGAAVPAARPEAQGAGSSPAVGRREVVPLVLLRRSEKKAPTGSDEVLVPARREEDAIAVRTAVLMAHPDGYGQFVLRLDRYVKTYLLNQPSLPDSRRAPLREPAYLFLSDRQGGFPAESFWLEQPDGQLRHMRDVAFVDTVVKDDDLRTDTIDGVEQIYAHELGHLLMAALAGPAPKKASSSMHFVTVQTDAWYAFTEGFGEHFQPMALDHYGDRVPRDTRLAGPAADVLWWREQFAREQEQGCHICPANLRFLLWHGRSEQRFRDTPLTSNQFIHRVSLPAAFDGDRRPPIDVRMYRDVMGPNPAAGMKNAVQMLESEGVIGTLFHRLASDRRMRETYRPAAFYRPFLDPAQARMVEASGPQAVVTPAENVYLKLFDVMHRHFTWGTWPAIDFVKGYARAFPDEAGALYDVYLDVTRGVTVDRAAGQRHQEPGFLAGLRDQLVAGRVNVDSALPPPLWITVPGMHLGMGLFRYFPVPNSLTLDLNAAEVEDLRSIPGVSAALAAAIVSTREARGGFARVEDLGKVPGVTPALTADVTGMHTKMQERLVRPQAPPKDAGWLKDWLVRLLFACYFLAASWQVLSASFVAGLGFLLISAFVRRAWPGATGNGRENPRRGWFRRALRAGLRGTAAALVPCLASLGLYALGVVPSLWNMAGVGLALGVVWCGLLVVRGASGRDRRGDMVRALAASIVMAVIIGGMY